MQRRADNNKHFATCNLKQHLLTSIICINIIIKKTLKLLLQYEYKCSFFDIFSQATVTVCQTEHSRSYNNMTHRKVNSVYHYAKKNMNCFLSGNTYNNASFYPQVCLFIEPDLNT